MTLSEYQEQAYVAIQEHASNKEEVMHWAIGLGEEAGETLSVIKHKYYGGEYDTEELVGELGDTLWHIGALCTALGIKMEDVAKYNLGKLAYRYPERQFDNERSIHRHDLKFQDTEKAKAIMDEIRSYNDLYN
jgi:NTP pyrophosphatase (non-canonical NTP hydrolase)